MFCHNCGKDCGDFRFCPNCGTKLQNHGAKESPKSQGVQESQSVAWTAGMPCPRCGGVQVEDGRCAFCGVQLIADQSKPKATEEGTAGVPCGDYNGILSSLTLYEKEFTVRNRISLLKKCVTTIPYDKLTSVVYVRKSSDLSHLLFRWEENKNVPIPEVVRFGKDPTTVTVSQTTRILFYSMDPEETVDDINGDLLLYHIFYMLKAITLGTTEFEAKILPVNNMEEVQALTAKTDVDIYYDRYAPYRDQAVKELQKRTGAAPEVANGLINWIFDKRQAENYAAEPLAAVRDFNLITAERRRREEKAERAEKERQEKNELVALLDAQKYRDED